MNRCFDAVRWQGLGEMVREMSPRQQECFTSEIESAAAVSAAGSLMRACFATMARIVRQGLPPLEPPPSHHFPIGSAVCYIIPNVGVRYGFVIGYEEDAALGIPCAIVIIHQGTLREERAWVPIERVRPATLQEVFYTQGEGNA